MLARFQSLIRNNLRCARCVLFLSTKQTSSTKAGEQLILPKQTSLQTSAAKFHADSRLQFAAERKAVCITMDCKMFAVGKEDSEELVEFLASDFIREEPLSCSKNATVDESKPFLQNIVNMCVEDDFSYCYRDEKGEIVAALINKLNTLNPDGSYEMLESTEFGSKMCHVSNLLNHMMANLANNRQRYGLPASKPYIELEILSVKKSATGKGLARLMTQTSLEKAKSQGCAFAITVATNIASQKLFEKMGFQTLYTLMHRDYVDCNGQQIFIVNNSSTDCAKLMMKSL